MYFTGGIFIILMFEKTFSIFQTCFFNLFKDGTKDLIRLINTYMFQNAATLLDFYFSTKGQDFYNSKRMHYSNYNSRISNFSHIIISLMNCKVRNCMILGIS